MEENYRTLGRKTFMVFVLDRINASFLLLLVAIVLFVVQGQAFIAKTPVQNLAHYIMLAGYVCLALFIILFAAAFLVAWLAYATYKFALGEDSLKIKRGILNKEEIAIPYRQIQDVDIDRDLGFRMMGLSRIMILTAGHEDVPKSDDPGQSEGVLPALDWQLAEWLQGELLRRANVQKVVEEAR